MSTKTPFRLAVGDHFHIYNRGVRKSAIFDSERNYIYFLYKVRLALTFGDVGIVCFCLMPNHFHFLLQQRKEDGVARFMKRVCDGYAKALNKQRGLTGHVFESKYKMKLIDSVEYLVWLSRYIHRNPKEAGLAKHNRDWEFSSYNDFVGSRPYDYVDPEIVLSQFPTVNDYELYVEDEIAKKPKGIEKALFTEGLDDRQPSR
jgi:REP element-mobilizing transposase RayT